MKEAYLKAVSVMAELSPTGDGAMASGIKTKIATTRKHLRRDQAATRAKRASVMPADAIKERQVSFKLL